MVTRVYFAGNCDCEIQIHVFFDVLILYAKICRYLWELKAFASRTS